MTSVGPCRIYASTRNWSEDERLCLIELLQQDIVKDRKTIDQANLLLKQAQAAISDDALETPDERPALPFLSANKRGRKLDPNSIAALVRKEIAEGNTRKGVTMQEYLKNKYPDRKFPYQTVVGAIRNATK